MSERDPFPMSSVEAKTLAASVDASGSTADNSSDQQRVGNPSSWSTMPMDGNNADDPSSNVGDMDEINAKSGLVARKKSVRKDEEEDIYAHVDKEIVDEEDEHHSDDPILDVPLEELRGDLRKRYKGQANEPCSGCTDGCMATSCLPRR